MITSLLRGSHTLHVVTTRYISSTGWQRDRSAVAVDQRDYAHILNAGKAMCRESRPHIKLGFA